METTIWILVTVAVGWTLAYFRAPLFVWTAGIAVALGLCSYFGPGLTFGLVVAWLIFSVIAVPLNIPPLRLGLVSNRLLAVFRRITPSMSTTEREALEA